MYILFRWQITYLNCIQTLVIVTPFVSTGSSLYAYFASIQPFSSPPVSELNAFIYDAHVLNYWVSRDEGCKLRIVGNLYAMTGYGIGFTKGHKWVEKINSRILDYQKNGRFNFDIINL